MAWVALSLQVLLLPTRTPSGRAGVPLPLLVRALMVSQPFSELVSLMQPLTHWGPLSLCCVDHILWRFMTPKENVGHDFSFLSSLNSGQIFRLALQRRPKSGDTLHVFTRFGV